MPNITDLMLVFFLTNLLVISLHPVSAYVTLDHVCPNTLIGVDSTYESNLHELFSSLSTDAVANEGFAEKTIGTEKQDQVSGLVLCRGDANSSICSDCLKQSFANATIFCPNSKEAFVWYDYCILGYSDDESFLNGFPDNFRSFVMRNTRYFTSEKFSAWQASDDAIISFVSNTLKDLLMDVAEYAAFNSTKRFGTGITNNATSFSGTITITVSLPTIYAVTQCTPDLSNTSCQTCLYALIDLMLNQFDGRQGGRIAGIRCNLRYEIYPFFSGNPDLALGSFSSPANATTPSGQTPSTHPTSHLPSPSGTSPSKPRTSHRQFGSIKGEVSEVHIIAISVTVTVLVLGSFIGICCIRKFGYADIKVSQEDRRLTTSDETLDLWSRERSSDFSLFDFNQIVNATTNFSMNNKLGQGGFGPVYKGVLPDGHEIAVKRLSTQSGQGLVEFKNEIELIAKLQHRNLVRLVGWCIHGEEKLLVYEFMPNKSLDSFIFDETRGSLLHWERRFEIIEGIAQGLLYLHKHSRLRIVHRDLKASNILLDSEMNPKISDFGLARIFNPEELQATNRVIGTYGYMAPEYASDGLFSMKSDVFSYGVLLLEIVSGKRNMGFFHHYGNFLNLLGYAWDRWKDGRFSELLCSTLTEVSPSQAERCIHVALLCVQENPVDRPIMSDVIVFLTTESIILPQPKHPAHFNVQVTEEAVDLSDFDGSSGSMNGLASTNPEVR